MREVCVANNTEDFKNVLTNIKTEKESYCEDMKDRISSSKVLEALDLDVAFVEIKTCNTLVKIVVEGIIFPEMGHYDELSISINY